MNYYEVNGLIFTSREDAIAYRNSLLYGLQRRLMLCLLKLESTFYHFIHHLTHYIMNTSFNNLDELIKFLFETANSGFPYTGKAYLKDEEIEFTGEYFEPDYFVISPFYPRTLFIIDEFVDSDDRFSVGIMMYYGRWDEFPAVHLPSKYIEEVIDRLQGFPRKEHFREAPEEPIP